MDKWAFIACIEKYWNHENYKHRRSQRKWDKVFKNGQSKICGRKSFKIWNDMALFQNQILWAKYQ